MKVFKLNVAKAIESLSQNAIQSTGLTVAQIAKQYDLVPQLAPKALSGEVSLTGNSVIFLRHKVTGRVVYKILAYAEALDAIRTGELDETAFNQFTVGFKHVEDEVDPRLYAGFASSFMAPEESTEEQRKAIDLEVTKNAEKEPIAGVKRLAFSFNDILATSNPQPKEKKKKGKKAKATN